MHLLFYSTNSFERRKHSLFLQKAGFDVTKTSSLSDLEGNINDKSPLLILTDDDLNLKEILTKIKKLPLVVILKNTKNLKEIRTSISEFSNPIFFRKETDPIDTILQTVKLATTIGNLN